MGAWPSEQPVISDGFLRLRAWEADDAGAVLDACQDPDIQRFTRVPVPYLPSHAEGFVQAANRQWESRGGAVFAVSEHVSGRVLGACGLDDLDEAARDAGIGYWVAAWARSRGVARAALRLVTCWAIDAVGLDRVYLEIEEDNDASVAVAQAAGYLRVDGPARAEHLKGRLRHYVRFEWPPPAASTDA